MMTREAACGHQRANTRDFAGTGVIVYDPWSGKTHQMEN